MLEQVAIKLRPPPLTIVYHLGKHLPYNTAMSLPYTLTILCASIGSPGFLRHLQKSDVDPLWIGEYPAFIRKYNPSNWCWSHVMLTEGHGVRWPAQCRTRQTWSFEIDADEAFVPDIDSMTDDGSINFDNKSAGRYKRAVRTRRYCALNFLAAEATEDEQKYKQHLSDMAERYKNLDMRIQFSGHISNTKENLGRDSKTTKPPKPSKKRDRVLTLAELEALDNGTAAAASTPAPPAEKPPPPATFVVLLSFPTDAEHKQFLELEDRAKADGGVKEEVIVMKHLYLPPKDKLIESGDWSYGNPHEPFGQDYFG
ncbi:hypothetical protein DE146DRAFT_156589 [Phaeosphaeria sp. MPI-PUGE-AT-0046c]|nr:hypothetical protein DE146DRAFT_156589 [Phaeosphaeria sp. MPI-PUGE-AT-0046c]